MDTATGTRATAGDEPPGGRRGGRPAGLLIAALIALTLGAAGCGGDSDKDNQAAPSGKGAQGGSTDSTRLVQYAQCMRKNGVPSFPDPVNGRFSLQVTKGGPLDPTNPQFQSAQQACKSLEPPGLFSGNKGTGQENAMLKFVACMRKNGVPDFPDPQDGRIVIGGGVDPNSPQFQSAMQACRKLLPGGGNTVGGGQ